MSSLNHLLKKTPMFYLVVSNGYLSGINKQNCNNLIKNLDFSMLDVSQLIPLDENKIISIISKYTKIIFVDDHLYLFPRK